MGLLKFSLWADLPQVLQYLLIPLETQSLPNRAVKWPLAQGTSSENPSAEESKALHNGSKAHATRTRSSCCSTAASHKRAQGTHTEYSCTCKAYKKLPVELRFPPLKPQIVLALGTRKIQCFLQKRMELLGAAEGRLFPRYSRRGTACRPCCLQSRQ